VERLKFSKSRYGSQKTCLGQYFYQYIEKKEVPQILWPGTLFGTATHLFIEENLNSVIKEKDIKKLPPFEETFFKCKKQETSNYKVSYRTPKNFNEGEALKANNSWIKEIIRFLFLYLPSGQKIFEEEVEEDVIVNDITLNVKGIIDLQVKNNNDLWIFDFKTTKHPNSWMFVYWDKDPQSLSYLFLKRKENPLGFNYLIFDWEDKMIFSNNIGIQTNEVVNSNLEFILKDFIKNHNESMENKNWNPSPENCKWCPFKVLCPKKA
jgi:hypothetical protein